MNAINEVNSGLTNLENVFSDLSSAYVALLKERNDAIIKACEIVELLNNSIFNVANVKFKNPIKVQYLSIYYTNVEINEICIEELFHCGALEYGVCGAIHTPDYFELSLEELTSDSLAKVYKEAKEGMWDVCLLDSDEDFHYISYEELRKRYKIECNKRYNQHLEQ